MDEVRRFVGIDVAKVALDVFWSYPVSMDGVGLAVRLSVCRILS
jgi:hypothetical protein